MDSDKASAVGRLSHIFFGWWTVLATGIIAGWGSGVWSYGFSSYFMPMQEHFGWTRAQVSAAARAMRYVLYPLARGRFFGRKAFASVQGISALMTLPASIASPIYAGWTFDITGSYVSVLTQGLVLLAIGSLALLFLDPPKPPKRVTTVTEFL